MTNAISEEKRKTKRKVGQKAGLTHRQIETNAIKCDGSPHKLAQALGITPPTAYQHLQKPEIKKAVANAREKALKAAELNRERVYKRLAEGLDATKTISCNVIAPNGEEMSDAHGTTKDFIDVVDFKERRETVKICLQLFGDLEDGEKDNSGAPLVVMPIININGQKLTYNIGEAIDAVISPSNP